MFFEMRKVAITCVSVSVHSQVSLRPFPPAKLPSRGRWARPPHGAGPRQKGDSQKQKESTMAGNAESIISVSPARVGAAPRGCLDVGWKKVSVLESRRLEEERGSWGGAVPCAGTPGKPCRDQAMGPAGKAFPSCSLPSSHSLRLSWL